MPRGAKLTPEVEDLISKVCIEHTEWLAKPSKIQQEVIRRLPDNLKMWGGPNWPGIDVIKDRLRKKIRPKLENISSESKRLDEPWSIGASVEHGIPSEASKDLFDIWRFSLALDRPISIRQAKWIVHIRNLFYPISTGNVYSDKVNRNLWLIRQSWLYSILERVSEIEEKHFNTANLDAASFMPNWEHAIALKLGKVSSIDYSQEALDKLEKHGTSLTSPPTSIKSVEQAVWFSVRAQPPPHMELMAVGTFDEVLPEEDDLVAAYWLTHLSKGSLWNDLSSRPEVRRFYEEQRRLRESGHFVPDSGGFPDDSMYSRQLAIRHKLLDWVKAHHGMSIRDYYALGRTPHASLMLSPKLLSMVGYEVPPEDIESYAKLHEEGLKAGHRGWSRISAEVKQRFVHDEQTDDDLKLLNKADSQVALELKQRETEFLELVRQKGGPPNNKAGHKAIETFWLSIRDEWIKKYPEYKKKSPYGYLQWEEVEAEYGRLKASLEKEATNERLHSAEG